MAKVSSDVGLYFRVAVPNILHTTDSRVWIRFR